MAINWAPTPAEEVVQNIRTLLATEPGSVPLSRLFGVPQPVDEPILAARAQLQAKVITAVRTYEPRVSVKTVKLTATADGQMQVTMRIEAP